MVTVTLYAPSLATIIVTESFLFLSVPATSVVIVVWPIVCVAFWIFIVAFLGWNSV